MNENKKEPQFETEKKKGNEKMDYKKFKEILDKIHIATNEVAKEIINEIKSKSETYGEVSDELRKLKINVMYGHLSLDKYGYLFNMVDELLVNEMNDLPLTNRKEGEDDGK